MRAFETPMTVVTAWLRLSAWRVAHIKAALAEARSGAPGVPHAEVVRWVRAPQATTAEMK